MGTITFISGRLVAITILIDYNTWDDDHWLGNIDDTDVAIRMHVIFIFRKHVIPILRIKSSHFKMFE